MFSTLAAKRTESNGKPSFWAVPNISDSPFTNRFTGELVSESELEVGNFVNTEYKKSFRDVDFTHPEVKAAKFLLARNILDESRHWKGMDVARQVYGLDSKLQEEAKAIHQEWNDLEENDLTKAYFAECGVFLFSLGVMRLLGGSSMEAIASGISEDELDHVLTNRNTLKYLMKASIEPSAKMKALIYRTLDWLMDGVSTQTPYGTFDKKFSFSTSDEIIEKGVSPVLTQMFSYTVFNPPFETENRTKSYTRVGE
jgi:hypothetical protein